MSCKNLEKNFNFQDLFLIFIFGSLVGVFYEEILSLVKNICYNNSFAYETRSGLIYGPFNPLYGFGFVVFTYILDKKERKWYITLLLASLLGGTVEYVISFLQETIIGTVSWDYSQKFLNINGRTTVIFMLFWGLTGLLYIKLVYPILLKWFQSWNIQTKNIIVIVLLIFITFDMLLSFTALIRQSFRKQNIKPYTIVGELYDKYYTDEYLGKIYNNMKVTRGNK